MELNNVWCNVEEKASLMLVTAVKLPWGQGSDGVCESLK